jgi:hypothetical protein
MPPACMHEQQWRMQIHRGWTGHVNYPMRTAGLCDQYNSISAKVKFDLLKCLLSKLHSGSRRLNSYTVECRSRRNLDRSLWACGFIAIDIQLCKMVKITKTYRLLWKFLKLREGHHQERASGQLVLVSFVSHDMNLCSTLGGPCRHILDLIIFSEYPCLINRTQVLKMTLIIV